MPKKQPSPSARRASCVNREAHTDCPVGYGQWHSWADDMIQTHFQIPCPGCGLFNIWIPKLVASPHLWMDYSLFGRGEEAQEIVIRGTGSQVGEPPDEVVQGELVEETPHYPMWEEWEDPLKQLRYFKLTASEESMERMGKVRLRTLNDALTIIKTVISNYKEGR